MRPTGQRVLAALLSNPSRGLAVPRAEAQGQLGLLREGAGGGGGSRGLAVPRAEAQGQLGLLREGAGGGGAVVRVSFESVCVCVCVGGGSMVFPYSHY